MSDVYTENKIVVKLDKHEIEHFAANNQTYSIRLEDDSLVEIGFTKEASKYLVDELGLEYLQPF